MGKQVYGLIDPVTRKIRYVGESVDPVNRYKQHIKNVSPLSSKCKWIADLKDQGLKPDLVILDENSSDLYWITLFQYVWDLVNYKFMGNTFDENSILFMFREITRIPSNKMSKRKYYAVIFNNGYSKIVRLECEGAYTAVKNIWIETETCNIEEYVYGLRKIIILHKIEMVDTRISIIRLLRDYENW